MRLRIIILGLMLGVVLHSQEPQQTTPATTNPAAPLVLENSGKPMTLPFVCTNEDIRWAGLSCSEEEPCAIFLELTAANQTGNRIVATGNIHSESVTIYSVLLASDDDGRTWTEAHDRIRGAGLEHVQFFDPETGWIVGQELFPIPQDPFLMISSDGGKTWRQHEILSESSENRFGSILQFGLSGKKDGIVVIDRGKGSSTDRYALFDSSDGGETWSIKQESSKPPVLKNAAVPTADWRVRADAPTKSYHVEHRQGARWIGVGAFSVKLDGCKPPE